MSAQETSPPLMNDAPTTPGAIRACSYLLPGPESLAENGRHRRWAPERFPEIVSPRLRFIPDPVQLLFHALCPLFEHIFGPPERTGLFLDSGPSFRGLQKEFYLPVRQGGREEASPLLFPYTTDSCATSLAAIHFHIKGPCIALHTTEPSDLEQLAGWFLDAGLIDCAVVGGLNYADPEWGAEIIAHTCDSHHVPFVDCAAGVLLTSSAVPLLPEPPEDFRARHGFTGAAERFLAYALGHGVAI